MGKPTRSSIVHRRALNQVMIYTGRAPAPALYGPIVFLRALRSALRMSQAALSRRSGVPQAHIARLESESVSPRLETLRRLFDAMFCDLLILPKPRKRPSDALAERELERAVRYQAWDD